MIELLAALSASAAVGMRIALPLLMIGLLYSDNLWADVPVLSHIPPRIVLGVLVSWSLVELLISKERLGQRFLQIVQLLFSPFVGAIAGITVARSAEVPGAMAMLLGLVGGLFAFVLQLVQVGWFYRLRGLPTWVIFLQDFLCIALVLLAFDAPEQGGLIALLLLWLAIRSSGVWQSWYQQQASALNRKNPRWNKRDPD
ncbi:DUF4126 domain-containing protein [Oculatella sp. FACHB-28]|uniref:DUF4126 domain-containing protein n=1 Tax=Cyanophyceae TaxID=3028117 RepID=UPI001687F601|nr:MULTISPECIES: DUF4126 domain-containing protein [Cyanophyceae]MBD1866683.1 DUF4126 domain-containing protein [Cyanobacteria bacterium FACHB-471]MBD2056853.1 DUF4126 domain-containing protein [Oculatella sp. FACHB-28]MBD2068312.1 DUF4126 domain-containing protein [Leptolyngbya sp. FACHB-671]